ncbi:hypothetical protein FO519_001693 [Halicephalobus sp. NKZ332]|nr:hypothetical protein FO519_001693 [Halicephalobus sp. NKZ332]
MVESGKTSVAGRLSEQINPPKKNNTMSTCGQLFLCIIGTLLSASICVWLAIFSSDVQWRRMLFSTGAAICALMFTMLAIATVKRQQHNGHPFEPIPIHRRSISSRRATTTGAPTRRPSDIEDIGTAPPAPKKYSLAVDP